VEVSSCLRDSLLYGMEVQSLQTAGELRVCLRLKSLWSSATLSSGGVRNAHAAFGGASVAKTLGDCLG